jgi:hypothetical protein
VKDGAIAEATLQWLMKISWLMEISQTVVLMVAGLSPHRDDEAAMVRPGFRPS